MIAVALIGALAAWAVDKLLNQPPLKATLANVDRDVGITLAEFSASRELASRDRPGRHAAAESFVLATIAPRTYLAQADDADADGVPDAQDDCPATTAAAAQVGVDGCPVEAADADADGVPDAQDDCPETAAAAQVGVDGCPAEATDADADGVDEAQDDCPGTAAAAQVGADGCPLGRADADADGVSDDRDRCPDTSTGARVGASGCVTARARVQALAGCSEEELETALRAAAAAEQRRRPACTSVVDLARGLEEGDSDDPEERAKAILSVLRSTRTRRSGSGAARPVGVGVSFDLTLEGFDDRTVEIRWSLYGDGRPVGKAWLRDHPVLAITGERETETMSPEFWVPLPKQPARYAVRIEVFDEDGQRLTQKRTRSFT